MHLLQASTTWRVTALGSVLLVLFAGAYIPEVGKLAWPWHFQLHFLAFMIVGGVISWTMSSIGWRWHTFIAVLIPLAHETCEIWGHSHGLETKDIAIDVVGSLAGVLLINLYQRMVKAQ
ncbi:hypothetical protein F9817_06595 [Vibrio sp. CAIM 722]|uniref:VanZ-like domain-containing protein n=1 Tax=Vibrio eleionomae TaxID=2653505 RepID=A0A7X4LJP6_9VIBR|nr:hypothetical protein [Vibrio eleionomae]MZI92862.1 hypothetical protein [Vibrio eleionomae]